jgi:hypothetical protein
MEIWVDGSSDGRRAAWAAMVRRDGHEAQIFTGIARDVPMSLCDRWALTKALEAIDLSDAPAPESIQLANKLRKSMPEL